MNNLKGDEKYVINKLDNEKLWQRSIFSSSHMEDSSPSLIPPSSIPIRNVIPKPGGFPSGAHINYRHERLTTIRIGYIRRGLEI